MTVLSWKVSIKMLEIEDRIGLSADNNYRR